MGCLPVMEYTGRVHLKGVSSPKWWTKGQGVGPRSGAFPYITLQCKSSKNMQWACVQNQNRNIGVLWETLALFQLLFRSLGNTKMTLPFLHFFFTDSCNGRKVDKVFKRFWCYKEQKSCLISGCFASVACSLQFTVYVFSVSQVSALINDLTVNTVKDSEISNTFAK